MIELDGSHGEGGGSILRQALALSIHTGQGFRLKNIRANRPTPGLSMQHLKALNLAHQMCGARVKGNSIRSTEVEFEPGEIKQGTYKVDIETAGSITLLLQAVTLPAVLSGKRFKFVIQGGTDVKWSPPSDYFTNVFLPHLRKYAEIDVEFQKRGYYPKGGGLSILRINSKEKTDFLVELDGQGSLLQIKGVSHASQDLEDKRVADRQAETADFLMKKHKVPVSISRQYVNTPSPGSGLTLWGVFGSEEGVDFLNPVRLGGSSLGEPRKKSEAVGEEAVELLGREIDSEAAADEHLADQLLPYLAVKGGIIRTSTITNHTLSNKYVAEKFLESTVNIEGNVIRVN